MPVAWQRYDWIVPEKVHGRSLKKGTLHNLEKKIEELKLQAALMISLPELMEKKEKAACYSGQMKNSKHIIPQIT